MILDEIKAKRDKPIPIIFGTDWWSDCDDVAALEILLKAHERSLIDLKAIGINSVMEYSAPSLRALCEQHGLDGIPIGIDKNAERKGAFCLYQKKLASFCRPGFSNSSCPEAYKLYRKALASSCEKAVIVEVGFPQIIMELLRSAPDEFSALDGMALVEEKVSKIIVMGGRWDRKSGREYNFCAYKLSREATAYICENCPVPLIFLGYEAGKDVISGGEEVPGLVGTAYSAHLSRGGRPSWDPMTALFAVIGDAEEAGFSLTSGRATVDPKSGKNSFEAFEGGAHSYLVKEKENDFYKTMIDDILMSE